MGARAWQHLAVGDMEEDVLLEKEAWRLANCTPVDLPHWWRSCGWRYRVSFAALLALVALSSIPCAVEMSGVDLTGSRALPTSGRAAGRERLYWPVATNSSLQLSLELEVVAHTDGSFSLQTLDGRVAVPREDGSVALESHAQSRGRFERIQDRDGKVSFQSMHGNIITLRSQRSHWPHSEEAHSLDGERLASTADVGPTSPTPTSAKQATELWSLPPRQDDSGDSRTSSELHVAAPKSAPLKGLQPRNCVVMDGWRLAQTGPAEGCISMMGIGYGGSVGSWDECLHNCAAIDICKQVVYRKADRACYGMAQSSSQDLDGIGGQNADYVSAHCHMTTTTTGTPGITTSVTTTTRTTSLPGVRLFCVSLAVLTSREPTLLQMQLVARRSIFACNGFAVYSNQSDDRLLGMNLRLFNADLTCKRGGKWNTLMNTPIFVKLWDQILSDREYEAYHWTAKVDPDSVFFPERLIRTLSVIGYGQGKDDKGMFLNNCFLGLHGPLEVLSLPALITYGSGRDLCGFPPQEDVYMQKCLLMLHVEQRDQLDILAEHECYRDGKVQSPKWQSCSTGESAFHPFKTVRTYEECLANADRAGDVQPALSTSMRLRK